MECRTCHNPVVPGDRFCQACGAEVLSSCARCGTRLAQDDKFCQNCGARVGAAEPASSKEGPASTAGGRITVASAPAAVPASSPINLEPGQPSSAPIPAPVVALPSFPPPPGFGPGLAAASPQFAPPAVQSFRYKGVWPRGFALIIDVIVLSLLSRSLPGAMADAAASAVVLSFYYFVYQCLLEGLLGATVGKMVLGMKVVDQAGNRPGIGRALVRNILRIIDFLPFIYIVGMLAIATSPRKQRVGDRAAGTLVVAR